MIRTTRCTLCTSDNYLEVGALVLHQALMHQGRSSGGTSLGLSSGTVAPMTQRAKMILCAHADLDGRGAHWRTLDELCWIDQLPYDDFEPA